MAPSKKKPSTSLDFPSELTEKLSELHKSIEVVEEALKPTFNTTVSEMGKKFQPLERAKIDLVSAYALNALFWIYLKTKGEKTESHDVKVELERIRGYMSRVKVIVDKKNAPKLDTGAAKRFLRSALWTPDNEEEPEEKKMKNNEDETTTDKKQRKSKTDEKHEKPKTKKQQKSAKN